MLFVEPFGKCISFRAGEVSENSIHEYIIGWTYVYQYENRVILPTGYPSTFKNVLLFFCFVFRLLHSIKLQVGWK